MIVSLIWQTIMMVTILTFSFGPSFFALINTGIKYGYRTGAFLAAGVVLSDFFLCVMVCLLVHFGMSNLLHSQQTQTFSAIIGGIVLIVFGALYFKKSNASKDETIDMEMVLPRPTIMMIKGFFLNLFNPTVWLLWLANVTAISKTLDYSIIKMLLFFMFVLTLVLFVELFKVKLAGKIKHLLTDKIMNAVNYVTGTALVLLGILLIYHNYFNG